MARLNYHILICLCGLIKLILSANYDLTDVRFECLVSPKDICVNPKCRTRPIKRGLTHVDFNCTLHEPIYNIVVKITLYYKFNEYRKFLIDTEEDMCDYLRNNKSTKVLNIAMPQIIASSNLKKCPLENAFNIKDMDINSERNPPGLPSGQYRLDLYFKYIEQPMFLLKVYFTTKPRGLLKLEMG